MNEPRRREEVEEPLRRPNWTIVSLIVGSILLALVVVYFMRTGNPDQDKLTNAEVSATTSPPSGEKLCSSSATYSLVKRALFERAAQLRGTDQSAFDKLAGYAVVRMDNPVMESQDNAAGSVNCSGMLSLDLPPGIVVSSGSRSLTSNVDYSVSLAAAGRSPAVTLRNADAIITPLSTLAQANPVPGQSSELPIGNGIEPVTNPGPPSAPPGPTEHPAMPLAQSGAENPRPSFDCAAAHSRSAQIVCGDASLAALDRQMASDYSHALASATPDQRDLLRDTGRRFVDFRNRCDNRPCIADVYSGRISEIRDIMEDRWQAH